MNDSEFSEDRVRNIITDEILKSVPRGKEIKKGFFAGVYLKSFKGRTPARFLATEAFVKSAVSRGERVLSIPVGAMITPLARELIDEKNLKVNYERYPPATLIRKKI